MKILLKIAYLGTGFCGYQVQNNGRTVQAELNRAAREVFGFDCDITGCSRTDSGVHAEMFCATVSKHGENHLPTALPAHRIPLALSAHLPIDLSVYDAVFVPDSFHARYDAAGKEYRYRFFTRSIRSPLEEGRSWHLPALGNTASLARMQEAALLFQGKHDFSAFMASGASVETTERTVLYTSVCMEAPHHLTFTVAADGFLYNMVRIMAGTLAQIGAGRLEPNAVSAALASLQRTHAGMTAPACGLYLTKVFYPQDPFIQTSDEISYP